MTAADPSRHLTPLSNWQKWREDNRLKGRCRECTEKATRGTLCEKHAKASNERNRRRYYKNIDNGLCAKCGRPVEDGFKVHNRNECVPSRRKRA